MALSLLASQQELATITDVPRARAWAGVEAGIWTAFSDSLGGIPNLRLVAALPASAVKAAIRGLRITYNDGAGNPHQRELTAVEVIQLAMVWRVARQAFGQPDVDPMADPAVAAVAPQAQPAPQNAAQPSGGGSPSHTRKLKMSSAVDQMDDTEVEMLNQAELDQMVANHIEITGSEPLQPCYPSPEQMTALYNRVVVRGEAPYADFSVLVPFHRRLQKQMKTRSWFMQRDGSWTSSDIPGPPTWEAWEACWKVFRSLMFMLRHRVVGPSTSAFKFVITQACMEEYFAKMDAMNREYPECWFLLMQADDKMRSEQFPRIRRQLTEAKKSGNLPMGLSFADDQPWIAVWTQAARSHDWWNEHVIRPAQNFLARGGKEMTKGGAARVEVGDTEAQAAHLNLGAQAPLVAPGGGKRQQERQPGEGVSKHAKKRRKLAAESEALKTAQAAVYSGGGAGASAHQPPQASHPLKDANGLFKTNREGSELCYRFAKGARGACPEPCQDWRVHGCQMCLGNHPNSDCQKGKGKGGKGGKNGKGGKGGKHGK